jgi:putative transcriptional regulator
MTPHHHPAEEFLLQYASGQATEPFALLVATHLSQCPDCRAIVAQAEAIGGALLDALPVEAPVEGVDRATIDRGVAAVLERASRHQALTPPRPISRMPSPLRPYLRDFDSVAWRSLGPGIQHSVIAKDRYGAVARLLRIAPGRGVFSHGHGGNEMTLVLQGSYSAGDVRYEAGDVECADETVTHQPVAGPGVACICLAVTDAPLQFRNLLGRIMQPFIRI